MLAGLPKTEEARPGGSRMLRNPFVKGKMDFISITLQKFVTLISVVVAAAFPGKRNFLHKLQVAQESSGSKESNKKRMSYYET